MTLRFVSLPERQMAERSAARRWLEARGFRVRQIECSSTPVTYFQVTAVAPLLAPEDFIAFAERQGWARTSELARA